MMNNHQDLCCITWSCLWSFLIFGGESKMCQLFTYFFLKLHFNRKAFEIQTQRCSKFKKFMNTPARFDGDFKTKLYLKLSRKEHYSLYSKGKQILNIRRIVHDMLCLFKVLICNLKRKTESNFNNPDNSTLILEG